MKDTILQVEKQVGDRAWEVTAFLWGQDSKVIGTIFNPNAGVRKMSSLSKM
jgi:hypothetical protein